MTRADLLITRTMQRIIVLSSRADWKLQRWQLSDRCASLWGICNFAQNLRTYFTTICDLAFLCVILYSCCPFRMYLSDKSDRYNGDSISISRCRWIIRAVKSGSFHSRAGNKKHGCQSPVWCPSSMHPCES